MVPELVVLYQHRNYGKCSKRETVGVRRRFITETEK